jgi:hypothetical protein
VPRIGLAGVITLSTLLVIIAAQMFVTQRQVDIHNLQAQLTQEQSNYAVQLGTTSNYSAPGYVATQAGLFHLATPTSVMQIPATSLDAPLPTPKFTGYAQVVSRTAR